jgi:prepilin-type N-terminal cleavage/methylation domain-containing protein
MQWAVCTQSKQKHANGFTIVELLIVIVVIAILATISVVSYTNIRSRATAATLQGDLATAAKVLENDRTNSDTNDYPLTLAAANNGKGITASNGAGYQYTVDNASSPKSYCLTGAKGSQTFYVDQGGIVSSGVCPGQVAPADNGAVVTTFAGSGNGANVDGVGLNAQLWNPRGLAIDSGNTLYVADTFNNTIRKITPAGAVTTIAGSSQGYTDGTGTNARFYNPQGIVLDASGNMYVTDRLNDRIRKITPAGVVSTLAGSTQGYADGTGTAAQFFNPGGITIDTSGNLYVDDTYNHRIRKITPAGVVTTLAGSTRGYADGTGVSAQFYNPAGLTIDTSNTLYIADATNARIRKVTASGVVTTLSGSTEGAFDGTATTSKYNYPFDLSRVLSDGTMYVSDKFNHRIKKVNANTGTSITVAGSAQGYANGTGTNALFSNPSGVVIDSTGALYIADTSNNRIRKIQLP